MTERPSHIVLRFVLLAWLAAVLAALVLSSSARAFDARPATGMVETLVDDGYRVTAAVSIEPSFGLRLQKSNVPPLNRSCLGPEPARAGGARLSRLFCPR
jgi:hypothetical protein